MFEFGRSLPRITKVLNAWSISPIAVTLVALHVIKHFGIFTLPLPIPQ
jgi:hypothetical protein